MRPFALLVMGLVLAGCGSAGSKDAALPEISGDGDTPNGQLVDPASHNADAIAQGQGQAEGIDAIWRRLGRKISFGADDASPHSFRTPQGLCDVTEVSVYDPGFAPASKFDLLSPDGSYEVTLNVFHDFDTSRDTPLSTCLVAVQRALGW